MDYTAITLNAAAKALEDTVLPALIAAGDKQATEQAHLVWDAVKFARDRVDLVSERRRLEAVELTDLIGQLGDLDEIESATESRLRDVRSAAHHRLDNPATSAEDYAALIERLGDEVTSVLREAYHFESDKRASVERLILEHGLRRLELDRSWLMPLGFDPEPATVRDLRVLLSGDPRDT
jgi:hypothetical protein